jgi:phage shock protein PspC (stress-responsive transcriptional regulator)
MSEPSPEEVVPERPAPEEPGGPPVRAPSPERPPLRRSTDDRVLGGVAGGLARRYRVSALGLRVAFGGAGVVVAFLLLRSPTGIPPGMSSVAYLPHVGFLRALVSFVSVALVLAYAALWVLVPLEGEEPRRARARRPPRAPGLRTWLGTLALIAGASLLGAQLGLWPLEVLWAFLLIGVGVLLFRRDAARTEGVSAPEVSAEPPPAGDVPEPGDTGPEPPPPRAPRERSPLGWIVLGLALLVVGGALVASSLDLVELRPVRIPALALLVLGAGMMVGAFVGRARWLLLPSLALVPLVLAASVVTVPLEGGIGDRWVSFQSVEEALGAPGEPPDAHRVVMGNVYVDLSELRCRTGTVPVEASSGFGSVSLYVPFDARVIASGAAGYGRVSLQARSRQGTQVELAGRMEPRLGPGITVVADLAVGIGDVSVYREHLPRRERERACR